MVLPTAVATHAATLLVSTQYAVHDTSYFNAYITAVPIAQGRGTRASLQLTRQ
jgi:hypothetical protein